MSLSEAQLAAAHRLDQDVCVVAGPGSGKTSVLIERFRWLVQEKGIAPNRILAITFTEKAANEIKERLVETFRQDPQIREKIERAYVSTIHGFCTRLLRENAISAAVDPEFEVLDGPASNQLVREAADEVLEDLFVNEDRRMRKFLCCLAVATVRDGFVPDLASSLIGIYDAMRTAGAEIGEHSLQPRDANDEDARFRGILAEIVAEKCKPRTENQIETHARLREWAKAFLLLPRIPQVEHFKLLGQAKSFHINRLLQGTRAKELQSELRDSAKLLQSLLLLEYYADERKLIVEALQRIHNSYRAKKRARSALDFSDLEEFAIELLAKQPELQERVRHSFDFILMDELQDTNPLQWKLLDLLRRPDRFFAVGDVNQSIFGFRHADPGLFHKYREKIEQTGQSVDVLLDNYRTRSDVLDVVNHTFDHDVQGVAPHTLKGASSFVPKLQSSIEVIGGFGLTSDAAERVEALCVARRIAELAGNITIEERGKQRLAAFSDVAILARSGPALLPILRALDDLDIPSIVLGGRTFFETREVRDLVLLLKVLANPRDEIALAGVLRSPFVRISDESLLRLREGGSLAAVLNKLDKSSAADFDPEDRERLIVFWNELNKLREFRDSISADRLLRTLIDRFDYESSLSPRRMGNVEKLLSILRNRSAIAPCSLGELLTQLENSSPEPEAPPNDLGNAVRVMTIHRSKGLEFPILFLPGLHTGRSTSTPIICYAPEFGLGVKWRDPAAGGPAKDALYDRIWEQNSAAQIEEDNRLLYVAMTRAREHMVLSFAKTAQARSPWWSLICRKLGVDSQNPLNDIIARNPAGVRVHTTDQLPEAVKVSGSTQTNAAPVLIAPPTLSQQYDSTASVTSVSMFSTCARKYYLSRYIRWDPAAKSVPDFEAGPPPDIGELSASEFGEQVHLLLAGKTVDKPMPEALELVARFQSSSLGQELKHAKRIEREFDLLMMLEDVVLRGQIDLWFDTGKELVIVDYKTDSIRIPIHREYLQAYALQLQIYAIALERVDGRKVARAYLHFLRPNEIVEVDLSPLQLGSASEMVRDFRDAHERLSFPLREGEHCHRCEFYKAICPAGKGTNREGSTYQPPSSVEALPSAAP